jgi:hypothetical protein
MPCRAERERNEQSERERNEQSNDVVLVNSPESDFVG